MEKRFTSSNKRIVEFCNLMESVKLKHMIDARILILEDVTSLGSLYISQDKTRQLLNEYLKIIQVFIILAIIISMMSLIVMY